MLHISVLGSTGSVGTQTLDVVSSHPDRFQIVGLVCHTNIAAAAEQAVRFRARALGAVGASSPDEVERAVASAAAAAGVENPVEQVFVGPRAADEVARLEADTVLNAITGAAGLTATLAALESGTDVALANKESLIIGGDVVMEAAAGTGARLLPVDSEHSAVWQALRSGRREEVSRLVITASGGPFRGMTQSDLEAVTPGQALKHPTWDMGKVITTNSATLVNKGLEVIEAHLLFDIPYDQISVVVHPQSQVHSMVEYVDGSTIAQVSPPDMKLPIAYALGYEERLPNITTPNRWDEPTQWTFEPVDHEAFPALRLAVRAGRLGGTAPAVYNAANEVLVDAFHAGQISFPGISRGISAALDAHAPQDGKLTAELVLAADREARELTKRWVAEQASGGGDRA